MRLLRLSAHRQSVAPSTCGAGGQLDESRLTPGSLEPWEASRSVGWPGGVGHDDGQTRRRNQDLQESEAEQNSTVGFRFKPDDQPQRDPSGQPRSRTPAQTEAYLRALFEQAPDAILVSDAEGHCLDASAAALELFDSTLEELRALPHIALLTDDPEWARVEFARLQEVGGWQGEVKVRRRGGAVLPVDVRACRVALQARRPVYVLNCRQIAARHRSEQQSLLAMTVHELRNPLTVIRSYAQLLQSRPALTTRALENIIALTSRLERLVDDLLALVSAGAGSSRLRLMKTDLTEVAQTTVTQAQALSAPDRVRLEAPPEGLAGHWDRQRLEQALQNLLSNALKYAPEGEILVQIVDLGTQAQVSVTDRGPGIRPEALPRIFEPFSRAADVASGGVAGSGLGLAVARAAVEAHRGRLWVESKPGQGSTFSFTLPYDPRQEQPEASVHLTRRELEVARLVALGKSNRDIAQALVLTPGTAANHVRRILTKCGFSSRSEIAAWMVGRGLVPPDRRSQSD